jgi:hypothetical protein
MRNFIVILFLTSISSTITEGQDLLQSADYVVENCRIVPAKDYVFAGSELPFSINTFSDKKGTLSELSKVAYIHLINKKSETVYQTKIKLSKGIGSGILKIPDSLKTDLYQIVAYTNWMRNFGEAAFGRHVISLINLLDKPTEIHSNKAKIVEKSTVSFILSQTNIKTKEPVELTINSPIDATFSFSIFRIDSLSNNSHPPIDLTQEVPDHFKLTFLPEYEGKLIEGKLINIVTGEAIIREEIRISIPKIGAQFFTTKTDSTGQFRIQIPNFVGNQEVFFTMQKEDQAVVLIDNNEQKLSFVEDKSFSHLTKIDSLSLAQNFLSNQINKNYRNFDLQENKEAETTFYVSPNARYDLDDFVKFPTIEDSFREFVSEVEIQSEENQKQVFVKQLSNDNPFANIPLILIDGLPITNHSDLLSMKPVNLKYFDIIRIPYYHHGEIFDGLIALTTKIGDLTMLKLPKSVSIIEIEGTQRDTIFPSEKIKDSRFPNFRTQLLWEPNLRVKAGSRQKLTFRTSEMTGKYLIEVKGFDHDGNEVYQSKAFQVND